MRKTIMHIVINTITNSLDLLVLNAIKPSLMELQFLLLINTGIEITSLAPNVASHSLMKSSLKMKDSHTAKNITTREEEPFVENVIRLLMDCVFLHLTRNGIKIVSPVQIVVVY